jgi:hypothetical protein
VTLYADNEYMSADLDFITKAGLNEIGGALAPLGFHRRPGARQFEHADTDYYVEFPPGPLAFGDMEVSDSEAATLQTEFGPLRIVTPTQIVMDRLAAYVHWRDGQSWDQAIMVVRRQEIDWDALERWAAGEGIEQKTIDGLRSHLNTPHTADLAREEERA